LGQSSGHRSVSPRRFFTLRHIRFAPDSDLMADVVEARKVPTSAVSNRSKNAFRLVRN
jgi:hypothetical protein